MKNSPDVFIERYSMRSHEGPILLVEDNISDQVLVKQVLSELEIKNELIVAANGIEALETLRAIENPVFLILADLNMPKMNGLELRREIEGDEELKRKSIPFIFMTSSGNKQEVLEAYEYSVQGYFEKSVDYDGTLELLSMILDYWSRCRHPNN